MIKKYARQVVGERLDVSALCQAKKRVEEIVARERVTQRSLTGRQRVARYLNLGQPDYSQSQNKSSSDASGQAKAEEPQPGPLSAEVAASAEPAPSGESVQIDVLANEPGWGADYSLPHRVAGGR